MPLPPGSLADGRPILFVETLAGPSTSRLDNIPAGDFRPDGQICWVEAVQSPYIYIATSTEVADGVLVIEPSDSVGRWHSIVGLVNPLPLVWGDPGAVVAGSQRFLRPGSGGNSTNEIQIRLIGPKYVKNLIVRAQTAPGAGVTDTFTVRQNGVNTALAVTLSNAETFKQDLTTAVQFLAGDDISIAVDAGAGSVTSDVLVMVSAY